MANGEEEFWKVLPLDQLWYPGGDDRTGPVAGIGGVKGKEDVGKGHTSLSDVVTNTEVMKASSFP